MRIGALPLTPFKEFSRKIGALPLTPFKKLLERSFLKIFKNFYHGNCLQEKPAFFADTVESTTDSFMGSIRGTPRLGTCLTRSAHPETPPERTWGI